VCEVGGKLFQCGKRVLSESELTAAACPSYGVRVRAQCVEPRVVTRYDVLLFFFASSVQPSTASLNMSPRRPINPSFTKMLGTGR
jgi:hypothetical protein